MADILTKSTETAVAAVVTKLTATRRIQRERGVRYVAKKVVIPASSKRHVLDFPPESKEKSDLLENFLRRQMRNLFDAADIPADTRPKGYVKPDNGSGYYRRRVEGHLLPRMFHCSDAFSFQPTYELLSLVADDDESAAVIPMSSKEWDALLDALENEPEEDDNPVALVSRYNELEEGEQRRVYALVGYYDGEDNTDAVIYGKRKTPRDLRMGMTDIPLGTQARDFSAWPSNRSHTKREPERYVEHYRSGN